MTDSIRSINRFELKYIVRRDVADKFIRSLDGYVYTDPNCNDEGGYPIYSLYCDSPGLSLFWEKIEGIKYRRKVRIRRYGNFQDAFLEIKQRVDRTLQKRRVKWPLDQAAETFCSGHELDGFVQKYDPVSAEIFFLWNYYGLMPRMAISYRRRAFFAVFETDLRITFDTRVQYHSQDLDILSPFQSGKYVIEPELVIIEIKFNERVPLWLCKIIAKFGLQHIRLSKYCTAVDREFFQGTLT
ncbi:MAG: polyphosphate polymerase domain-containing protein [Deltaproteobacteria bacterium]|nr:polyphosphate polymerase domain-containing protein [Deltaproteobacteria bacterium]